MTAPHTAYIGLGSNLGDRVCTLRKALASIDDIPGVQTETVSSWYETEPLDMAAGSPLFLNGAAKLRVALEARVLLESLLGVERLLGRTRRTGVRYESRHVDVDLLIFDDEVRDDAGLQLPHPRMTERLFVLVPLAEIAGERIVPGTGLTVQAHLQALSAQGGQPAPTLYHEANPVGYTMPPGHC